MAKHETGIEWTHVTGYRGATWNPLGAFDKDTGRRGWFCTHVSEGCRNCYAEKLNVEQRYQMGTGHEYKHQNLKHIEWRLVNIAEPIRKKAPRAYFVNSMTDLWHPDVPEWMIDQMVASMVLSPQHLFMILTKRPSEMADWFHGAEKRIKKQGHLLLNEKKPDNVASGATMPAFDWPPEHIWFGTSTENQEWAKKRIMEMLRLPSEVTKFISAEPLISSVDLTEKAEVSYRGGPRKSHRRMIHYLDWVIVGGESGAKARPMDPDWARQIRDACQDAGVPFFFKQGSQNNWSAHKKWESFPADLQIREFPANSIPA